MHIQLVQFRLKTDSPRSVFLELTEQMLAWLKTQEGPGL